MTYFISVNPQMEKLAQKNIFFGTSSWKYEGWKGLIYNKKYTSDKAFQETCLEEYAEHFSTVGVDHTYYQWPSQKTFEKYCSVTPSHFRFGLKATERVTVFQFPNLPRYGRDAGKLNEHFLDSELFAAKFLEPLYPFAHRLGPIMLEFSQFYPGMISSGKEFLGKLEEFFSKLGQQPFSFSIEIRNKSWVNPKYFEKLQEWKVSHVFNSWTRMPSIGDQLEAAENFSPPMFVSRLLLEPGTKYEEAVEAYSPYDRIQKPLPSVRSDTVRLVRRSLAIGVPAYVFVNNRCEGCAPGTVEAILSELS